ncbi:MAG: ammonium transporter [Propionibacteriales bacterium]|nr:ammonium transporter [Propionibacteriales bacterium]
MQDELSGLTTIFTEFYYWVTVFLMFFIHIGFATYEVAVARRKNLQHTLMKNILLIPLVTITFFFFGWWIYFALPNGPGITGGLGAGHEEFFAWSETMGPHMQDRINGVFWAAFLLFSWTAASIVSGAVMERIRVAAFLIIAVLIGSVTWVIDAAWGWKPDGWMVQLMGYHDAYASGVIHAIAGGTALAVIMVLGPRIGKFGPNGVIRAIRPHNVWMACLGLFLIYTGFWGFYVACNIPIIDVDPGNGTFFSATNIYLMPTTLSGITLNFLMSLSGGLLAGYLISKRDPFWTFSGGLAGIIAASAGNDLYHPIQAMLIGGVGAALAYKLHNFVERRWRIDDAVGAVAVHGYAGFFGVVIAGFLLWGYPAAAPVEGTTAWFTTPEGWPAINPIGNFIGAVIMFGVLGFLPAFVVAKVLDRFGLLRVPRAVELAGLDTHDYGDSYPYFEASEPGGDFETVERQLVLTMTDARLTRLDGDEPPGSRAREDREAAT